MKFTFLLVRGNLFHSKILCPTLAVREGINHRVFKISTITLSSGDTTSFILTSVTYRLFKFQKFFLLSWDGTIQKTFYFNKFNFLCKFYHILRVMGQYWQMCNISICTGWVSYFKVFLVNTDFYSFSQNIFSFLLQFL